MSPENNEKTIKITLDDLENVQAPGLEPMPAAQAGGAKVYGSINAPADPQTQVAEEKGSLLLQAWFYLGVAGLAGSVVGWGICEPRFLDATAGNRWGNWLMIPLIVALLCVGFGVAESAVERSAKKAAVRGLICLVLGVAMGFIFEFIANIFFNIGLAIIAEMGVQSFRNPAAWIVRGFAWMWFTGSRVCQARKLCMEYLAESLARASAESFLIQLLY
jgi:hypothetical protein